jgi:hypothetical protein
LFFCLDKQFCSLFGSSSFLLGYCSLQDSFRRFHFFLCSWLIFSFGIL